MTVQSKKKLIVFKTLELTVTEQTNIVINYKTPRNPCQNPKNTNRANKTLTDIRRLRQIRWR